VVKLIVGNGLIVHVIPMHLEIEFQISLLFTGKRGIYLFNVFLGVVYALRLIEGLLNVLWQVGAVKYFLKVPRCAKRLIENFYRAPEVIRIAVLGNQKSGTAASPEKQGGEHPEEYGHPDLTQSKLQYLGEHIFITILSPAEY
jgi:hypothetical protein